MATEIERMFRNEVREKKKIARGSFNRASRTKGFRGSVKFAWDLLSAKEKRKLNGKVVSYNMYDNVTFEEFKTKNYDDKKAIMRHLQERFGDNPKVIAKHWGCKLQAVYDYRQKLKLAKPVRMSGTLKLEDVDIENVTWKEILQLNYDDRTSLLVQLQEGRTFQELADKLNISKSCLMTMRTKLCLSSRQLKPAESEPEPEPEPTPEPAESKPAESMHMDTFSEQVFEGCRQGLESGEKSGENDEKSGETLENLKNQLDILKDLTSHLKDKIENIPSEQPETNKFILKKQMIGTDAVKKFEQFALFCDSDTKYNISITLEELSDE